MAFSWDGKYVLRRVDETNLDQHRIYWHGDTAGGIRDDVDVIDWAPVLASKARFDAVPIKPPSQWPVRFDGVDEPVLMGVFQLIKI